jgi:multisubunit Na+/H+ antiporter MnhE subunit
MAFQLSPGHVLRTVATAFIFSAITMLLTSEFASAKTRNIAVIILVLIAVLLMVELWRGTHARPANETPASGRITR